MATSSQAKWSRWRELLAVGLVAGDLNPDTVARCAGVSRLEVLEAFVEARAFGVLDENDRVAPEEATRLEADLGIDKASFIHAEMARYCLSLGREALGRAVFHARQVTSADDTDSVIAMCDHSGEVNLSLGDYRSARQLLEVAAELDISGNDQRVAARLLKLSAAVDGAGDVLQARKLLERASAYGERLGDVDLVVEAAVRHTLPTDWYAGDHRSMALLQRTEAFELSPDQAVRVAAARGLAEMRIPVQPHGGQQVAWITRPEAAQPLTEWALRESGGRSPEARAMALLAWRSTHRSPAYLHERRSVSQELVNLSQLLRQPALQVDAAVYLAVDAIESGDRPLYDKALGITRWVAERDGSARLSWRAHTLAAGAAHLDDDVDLATREASAAQEKGQSVDVPGWFAAAMFFEAQRVISVDDPMGMSHLLLDDSQPGMNNPLALAGIGYCFARCGDLATARRYTLKSIRQLDFEASALLALSRLSANALAIGDADLQHQFLELLTPWSEHVVVDSNAWWCDGPVVLWLALLHESLGQLDEAREFAGLARSVITDLHDVRSRRRLTALDRRLDGPDSMTLANPFTTREVQVLHLLAQGATNAQIATTLNYSVSTVRNETVSLYRKLGVSGRAEAVAQALRLGLVTVE
jgi:DNA-binding CsgD family transcriptional regulator